MRRIGLTQLAMLAPAHALLLAALALPALHVLWLSFTDSSYGSGGSFVQPGAARQVTHGGHHAA